MPTEFEAKFYPINKQEFREKLVTLNAKLLIPEIKTVMAIYNKETNPQISSGYIRVRNEGDKIRLSSKVHASASGNLSDQKETDTIVSDFEATVNILEDAGLKRSGYQEKLREIWDLDGAEVNLDTWPGLETYVEIEAKSEEAVEKAAEKLGLNWENKIITSVIEIYMEKYRLSVKEVLQKVEWNTFDQNSFQN